MGIVEGKTRRRGGKQMPEDKRLGNKWRMQDRNLFGGRRKGTRVFLHGLAACRWAAALSERDVAELAGASHPTSNILEVNPLMLERIRQVLKVWREDLTNEDAVEDTAPQDGAEQRSASVSDEERTERRREVNRIKSDWRLRSSHKGIRLGGLKARRLEAGLSEKELARIIGTNLTTIRELENERRSAYPKTIRNLCPALGVRPADLICSEPVK
jgi:DNA-binding XRE family transcriptional regulator